MFDWAKRFWAWLHATDVGHDVEAVRLATAKLCGFLPTVQTVVSILALNNPALQAANAIAGAICMAISSQKVATKLYGNPTPPVVQGVPIEGEWLKNS